MPDAPSDWNKAKTDPATIYPIPDWIAAATEPATIPEVPKPMMMGTEQMAATPAPIPPTQAAIFFLVDHGFFFGVGVSTY